eukprot:gnl/TRDRNA2_/TRDRNA2_134161_c0_seq2.p1 gnl/TRDRNA2_/TRDRNA2_134161_c0~~gnl/TRDRNA2_/TRDRNA2_134161_c0_seq2.p1  ORF type:complete len:633 (-),score=156.44 gnl/TRDRNA2_/TRDRNA2_134161_c0_seq2:180-2078(-)
MQPPPMAAIQLPCVRDSAAPWSGSELKKSRNEDVDLATSLPRQSARGSTRGEASDSSSPHVACLPENTQDGELKRRRTLVEELPSGTVIEQTEDAAVDVEMSEVEEEEDAREPETGSVSPASPVAEEEDAEEHEEGSIRSTLFVAEEEGKAGELKGNTSSGVCESATEDLDESFLEAERRFNARYERLEKTLLGKGRHCKVYKAQNRHTCQPVAMKCLEFDAEEWGVPSTMIREIALLKELSHPNVIRLLDVLCTPRRAVLVFEFLEHDLRKYMKIHNWCLTPAMIKGFGRQLCQGVAHCHLNRVIHRDIKPENFLLQTKGDIDKVLIKIIDFGIAARYKPGVPLTKATGTPDYIAPEVLSKKYDNLVDVWSCGVVLYILLCGYPPFTGNSDAETFANIKRGAYSFDPEDWGSVSKDAIDLIKGMLCLDAKKRMTAEQVLNHKWIVKHAPEAKDVALKANSLDRMQAFTKANKLKKAAMHVIAQRLQEDDIKVLREQFMTLDANKDGMVTFSELKNGLDKLNLKNTPDLQSLMAAMDVDESGSIQFTDFVAATLDKKHLQQENVCWQAFRIFDKDQNGTISKKELSQVLHNSDMESFFSSKAMEQVLKEVDTDGDGTISFDEFMKMMKACGK